MAIETNERGQLFVVIPRIQYAIAAALLAATAVLFVVWMVNDPLGSPEMPHWVRACAALFCIVFAAGFGWLSFFGQPLTFDAHRGAIVKGEHVLVRFADVDHVELREKRTENATFWRVRVRLANSRSIDLGPQPSDIDADLIAARVATVVGKPVRHVVR